MRPLATGGQAVGDWAVTGVSIDTRTLQSGDLFVALKAARDGHDFVANALPQARVPHWCRAFPMGWMTPHPSDCQMFKQRLRIWVTPRGRAQRPK